MRGGHSVDLFGEGHHGAGDVIAAESAYLDLEDHADPGGRNITQLSQVAAVNTSRGLLATVASRGRGQDSGGENDIALPMLNTIDQ